MKSRNSGAQKLAGVFSFNFAFGLALTKNIIICHLNLVDMFPLCKFCMKQPEITKRLKFHIIETAY